MKDLLLGVLPQILKFHVVIWQTTSKNSTQRAWRTCSTIIFLHLSNQIIVCWCCRCRCRRRCLNSLLACNTDALFIVISVAMTSVVSKTTPEMSVLLSITFGVGFQIILNRPYSYSHGCTGNEHEREGDAGKSFQIQIISPA